MSMGLGQLPPQSAAPVVMNVAGGLRVELFPRPLRFPVYFADIRAHSGSAGRGLAGRGAPATIERPKGKRPDSNVPHDRAPGCAGEISGLINGTDADCQRTDGDQWVPQ